MVDYEKRSTVTRLPSLCPRGGERSVTKKARRNQTPDSPQSAVNFHTKGAVKKLRFLQPPFFENRKFFRSFFIYVFSTAYVFLQKSTVTVVPSE